MNTAARRAPRNRTVKKLILPLIALGMMLSAASYGALNQAYSSRASQAQPSMASAAR